MKIDRYDGFNFTVGFGLNSLVLKSLFSVQLKFNRHFFLSTFLIWILLSGCNNTEGIIRFKGKVIDDYTKEPIPGKKVIIQGLVVNDDILTPIDADQFSTDSSGNFSYSFKKIKDAYSYNFCFVGDSDYAFKIKKISLRELERNAKNLSFSLDKLVDLTIKIYRTSKKPVSTTLFLSWKSDGLDGRFLYPHKINNYGLAENSGLIWKGDVKSTITTKVFENKLTTVRCVIYKTMKIKEIVDTITCKRDVVNEIYLRY